MISKFNEFNIHEVCREYGIRNYTISNGLVDVDGDVDLSGRQLDRLPLNFGKVAGDFYCSHTHLTTLEGAPKVVGLNFYCGYNKLNTLEGAPKEIGEDFYYTDDLLPKEITDFEDIKYILKWQDEYNIWKRDGSLDLF